MQAVILAAGQGLRLRPLTFDTPKVMLKIGSKPILQRIMENLKQAGITDVLMVVGYKKDDIEGFFGEKYLGIKITYFLQKKQLGTAHAISLVEGFAKGNFLAINADVLIDASALSGLAQVDEFDPFDAVIVAREAEDPWRYGCLLVDGSEVKDIVEKPSPGQEPSNLVNAGIYRFNEKIFEAIKKTELSKRNEFEIVNSIKIMMKAGSRVTYRKFYGTIIDIGDAADLKRAQQIVKD